MVATSTARAKKRQRASGRTDQDDDSRASGSTRIGDLKSPKEKPPKIQGYYWRGEASGWQLRRCGKKGDPNKDRYIARLSGDKYGKMKARHEGQPLIDAVTKWAVNQIEKTA